MPVMAVLRLFMSLGLYIWLVRSNASCLYATNVVCWLLMRFAGGAPAFSCKLQR
jgi:hypothetical protein